MLSLALAATLLDPRPVYVGRDKQLAVSPPRIEAEAKIDGVLSEDVWQQAALLTGFSQFAPQDKLPAADSTHIYIWYSRTALYVGVRAFEAHGAVHATLADRDKILADDNVQLLIGTYHDRRQAYVFGVNPLGVQMDGTIVEQGQTVGMGWVPSGSGRTAPDLSQDFIYTSKGHITPAGYEVEIRIPFKSIKYQATDVQTWDLNVVRQVQHSGFEDSWVPAERDAVSFLSQSGTLEGLQGIERGLVLDVAPIATQYATGAPSPAGWKYSSRGAQLGGNVRWGITNNLTLNGTARPDFAEVESDAGQFTIDPRQALFYPEKRPFFLEGLDQFATPHNLIYTRRIVKPDAAAALTGKVAGMSIGVLSARDAADVSADRTNTYYNLMRLQRDVGAQSKIGVTYTDRASSGGYNRVLDVDGRIPFAGVYAAGFQWAQSYDRTAGGFRTAPLWEASVGRNGKHFVFRYIATGIADNFRPRSGFVSRPGVAHMAATHRYTWFGAPGALMEALTGDVTLDNTWQYARFIRSGDAQDKKLHFSGNARLRGGWSVGLGVFWETFGFDNGLYSAYSILTPAGDTLPFTGTPRIPNRDYVFTLSTPRWQTVNADLLYVGGQDENFFEWAQANIDYVSAQVHVRPTDRVRVDGTLDYQDFWRRSDGTLAARNAIPRVKLEYQLTRAVFVRAVGEYDRFEHADLRDETRTFYPLLIGGERALAMRARSLHGDYLLSYTPSPGTVFFLGYGSLAEGLPDVTRRYTWQPLVRRSDDLFVKLSYLFRM